MYTEAILHSSWRQHLTARGWRTNGDGAPRAPSPPTMPVLWAELSHFGVLELRGPDARAFLQGYVTCDLDELKPGRALEGGYCNLQGRLVADFTLVEHAGALRMVLDRSLGARVAKSLAKYLAFSKSRLTDVSDDVTLFGFIEPAKLRSSASLPSPREVVPLNGGVAIGVPGTRARALVIASPDAAALALDDAGSAASDRRAWDRIDVDSMIAHVTEPTSEAFLPQMWGLEDRNAISFTKGCYLGQEVVARAQHRGQVKRTLLRLLWRGREPAPGLVIREQRGNSSATVVSSVATSDAEGLALAIGPTALGSPLHADGVTFARE